MNFQKRELFLAHPVDFIDYKIIDLNKGSWVFIKSVVLTKINSFHGNNNPLFNTFSKFCIQGYINVPAKI